ncbi:MAG TPA: hypothetical protein VNW73_06505 [Ktedonobacteraceae bacterium]|jgi:hypothetical protein|nr:hypothetical protein [Ktedonobacteraceae bacterium]
MRAAQASKFSQQSDYEIEEDEEYYITRPHSSVRRYNQPVQRDTLDDVDISKGASVHQRRTHTNPYPNSGKLSHDVAPIWRQDWRHDKRFALIAVVVGMLLMAALFLMMNTLGSWWQVHQDDVTYGRPRTYQVDAVVGHNDSVINPSHFIFLNLNRHVMIIELPGGDTTHARIYNGPTLFGNGQDLTPVTAVFKDVNGDGKIDMIVQIQDQRLVFINDGTQFVPRQPGQQVHL